MAERTRIVAIAQQPEQGIAPALAQGLAIRPISADPRVPMNPLVTHRLPCCCGSGCESAADILPVRPFAPALAPDHRDCQPGGAGHAGQRLRRCALLKVQLRLRKLCRQHRPHVMRALVKIARQKFLPQLQHRAFKRVGIHRIVGQRGIGASSSPALPEPGVGRSSSSSSPCEPPNQRQPIADSWPKRGNNASLSPGERAGVRAGSP